MFEHDMEESKRNLIEIHEQEPQVFKAMIGFIYTWKAPYLHSIADAVLATADKYGLGNLKNSGWLKTQALDFITAHASEVSETSSWKTVMGSYLELEHTVP
ncbi:Speckle-type POZ protein [Cricetulus griseus]|uniref:Speckle-type POZ protein n=1 Tax=Cricetulus griseus TaxID=10029 RepID=G3HDN6_CRIGR|nr:Speckle-type POZ protein [Cricetulus griseus]ERE88180.1 speckle-type POZ protein [Cricetulus griseus]